MNSKRAKTLRRKVYGAGPKRNRGEYALSLDGKSIVCAGLRRQYLDLKKREVR